MKTGLKLITGGACPGRETLWEEFFTKLSMYAIISLLDAPDGTWAAPSTTVCKGVLGLRMEAENPELFFALAFLPGIFFLPSMIFTSAFLRISRSAVPAEKNKAKKLKIVAMAHIKVKQAASGQDFSSRARKEMLIFFASFSICSVSGKFLKLSCFGSKMADEISREACTPEKVAQLPQGIIQACLR